MPSSTEIESGITSFKGTMSKNPDVGLGVVGTKQDSIFSSNPSVIFPSSSFVTKPMAKLPALGYSTRTTRENLLLPSLLEKAEKICLIG